ncbi:MFS transporter [Qaidamihabitans albus]|uniref:MFS transporter n=1 Tax=Qaidamihabitans albus TaxID=2795733 RepID=UPI0018F1DD64|nr:MFS transporter [Qaidamihabitans albus]
MAKTTARPAVHRTSATAGPGRRVLLTLLAVTLLGTVSNNVINVPLRDISRELGVPLSAGVLAVASFVLVLAATMPLMGWVGDRFGRRRTLIVAQVLLLAGMVGAALAPSLPVLAASRALQGLACAAAPPCVMGMLASVYGPARRNRTMGAWAAANGIGQALGPPLGGLVAGPWGWRAIFWLLVPVSALLVVALVWLVPAERARPRRLHWPGTVAFTTGIALLMAAAALAPGGVLPWWWLGALGLVGVGGLIVFVLVSRRAAEPFVPPALLVEPRFLRSGVAACAQMFCLGATLVAMPLYVTGALGLPTALAGVLVFALPATMAVLATVVGRLSERTRPRWVLRGGLGTLVAAELGLGVYVTAQGGDLVVLCILLVAIGAGVALVQTPAAAGATRSAAGQAGAALGLFNTLRFGGATLGTVWVGLSYTHAPPLVLFGGAAAFALAGLLVSFAGRDPAPV